MTDNLAIWNELGKTDPDATKGFNRSGGFKGTAVKPMWVLKRLTEKFGPAGVGWGVNKPDFQVVPAEGGEILVYCTVSTWHGDKENLLWGVGGDKVVGKNKNGLSTDDEAFKKAFTDAVGNAFKSIGVAADIHMGLFDDAKYVSSMREEFAPEQEAPATISEEQRIELMQIFDHLNVQVDAFLRMSGLKDLRDLLAENFDRAKLWVNDQALQARKKKAA